MNIGQETDTKYVCDLGHNLLQRNFTVYLNSAENNSREKARTWNVL